MTAPSNAAAPLTLSAILAEELRAQGHEPPPFDPADAEEARVLAIHRFIRNAQPDRSALCISGGGIRSATFALGVVQGLAKAGLLAQFDYLSTVSGGGYLGSFLSARLRHHAGDFSKVTADLAGVCDTGSAAPEAPPLTHLRRFSNYISPKLGFFSADGWTLVATALRNLLLNWLVLVTLLAAVLVVPWFGLLPVLGRPSAGQLQCMLCAAFACFALATAYPGMDLPSFSAAHRRQSRFLECWLLPLTVGVLLLAAWWAGSTNTDPHALEWMQSFTGKMTIGIFLASSNAVGVVACTLQRRLAERSGARTPMTRKYFEKLVTIVLATLLVIGIPGAILLWNVAVNLFPTPASNAALYCTFAPALLLAGFFLLNSLFVGVTSRCTDDDDREWWARATGWVLALAGAWMAAHALVFYVPALAASATVTVKTAVGASGGIVGFIAAKVGASSKTPAFLGDHPQARRTLILATAAFLFFALLACALGHLFDATIFAAGTTNGVPTGILHAVPQDIAGDSKVWIDLLKNRTTTDRFGILLDPQLPQIYWNFFKRLCATFAVLCGGGFIMGWFINVNRFSLHATYRNRLVRAYLGAARTESRAPHPFTGFDPADNIAMSDLTRGPLFHIVNITLNLVAGHELAWQERKADSFTVSRLHSGCRHLGYRPSHEYGENITLGTALAISGAAASPNQGYHSSPLVTFLMALFNVRLGWWLGNPGVAGWRTWTHNGPRHAALPLLAEAFGFTDQNSGYVNLSDGGHFENLAIYEMLVRRCHCIVAIDAEQDGDYAFEGLGGIVRKARVDFGIPIEMHGLDAVSKHTAATARSYFAMGSVRYSVIDPAAQDGVLLYIKPLIKGSEPIDIINYWKSEPEFPHEPTSDQFFSESQFESYRALGLHEITQVLRTLPAEPTTPAEMLRALKQASNAAEMLMSAVPIETES